MPRKSRNNYVGVFSHVMVQGINKEKIFQKNFFKNDYLKILYEKCEEYELDILAYCIMNNHAHLLIHCESHQILTEFMKKVNIQFSVRYNKMNERCGYVFRDRYKSEMVEGEEYLYNCLVYIHRNPVKAGIVKKCSEYYFSSYNEFFKDSKFITKDSKKILFGDDRDFLDNFIELHRKNVEDDFLDEKMNINDYLKYYLKENNIELIDVRKSHELFSKFIKQARINSSATLKEICYIFGISYSTCYRMLKSNN